MENLGKSREVLTFKSTTTQAPGPGKSEVSSTSARVGIGVSLGLGPRGLYQRLSPRQNTRP